LPDQPAPIHVHGRLDINKIYHGQTSPRLEYYNCQEEVPTDKATIEYLRGFFKDIATASVGSESWLLT
jgi:hypothetical protein